MSALLHPARWLLSRLLDRLFGSPDLTDLHDGPLTTRPQEDAH